VGLSRWAVGELLGSKKEERPPFVPHEVPEPTPMAARAVDDTGMGKFWMRTLNFTGT
jgi:hypothetical protein